MEDSFITFHNPLETDFTFRWDKKPYTVKAGETVPLQPFLARHGAKHLTDYIILNSPTWQIVGIERTTNDLSIGREEILDKILDTAKVEMVAKTEEVKKPKVEEKEEVKNVEKEFEELEDKLK